MGSSPSSLVEASSPSVTGRPIISPNPLPSDALSSLQSLTTIKDITFLPDSSGYRETNVCWNFDAIGSPSVIFTPRSEEELKSILDWYQSFPALWSDHGLSIHAGGHSHYALKNHSIVIHLKHFNKKELNKETNIGTFGAGLRLGDLDAFTQSYGLATVAGTNPDTGISGLTLGGGFGYLARQYGLTIDNVVGFRVMLLDGRIVDATKDGEYNDLYWALKGGGGNFGIVLEYRYQLHKRGDVLQGACVFLTRQKSFISIGAEEIIRKFRDHFLKAPKELGVMIVLPCGGPLVFPFSYTGHNLEEGQKLMGEVTKLGSPMIKKVFQSKYAVEKNSLQWSANDHQQPGNWYEAGIILKELNDDVINLVLKYSAKPNIPNTESQIILAQLGGKIDEIKEDETPFLGRNAPFWLMTLGKWSNCKNTADYLSERNKVKQWVKNIVNDLKPYSKAGSYQTLGDAEVSEPKKDNNNNNNNNNNEEEKKTESPTAPTRGVDIEIAPEWYGINYARLVEIKQKYDPKNIFRHNKNIDPNAKA